MSQVVKMIGCRAVLGSAGMQAP